MLRFLLKLLFCAASLYHSFAATLKDAPLSPKTALLYRTAFRLDRNIGLPFESLILIDSQQHFNTLHFFLNGFSAPHRFLLRKQY